eukprot:1815532-Pleurochrysis_carterae.AAC.3
MNRSTCHCSTSTRTTAMVHFYLCPLTGASGNRLEMRAALPRAGRAQAGSRRSVARGCDAGNETRTMRPTTGS